MKIKHLDSDSNLIYTVDTYPKNRISDEFNKSVFEPQNIEQEISNFEFLPFLALLRFEIPCSIF